MSSSDSPPPPRGKNPYGWLGLKAPVGDPNDPEYCESGCVICKAARAGHPLAGLVQKVELVVTRGAGCPWGRARKRKYGVGPDQPLPPPDGD